MSNMNIYKVTRIGILVLLLSGVLSIVTSIVFMSSYTAQMVASSVVSILVLGWTVFQAYKIWSVKEVNSGFRKFSIAGIIMYIFTIFSSLVSIILGIRNIGKPQTTMENFSMESLEITGIKSIDNILKNANTAEGLSDFRMLAIAGIVIVIVSGIISIYLMNRYYRGLYSGTDELIQDHPETVDELKKVEILERISGLDTITKVALIYIPIVFIVFIVIILLITMSNPISGLPMIGVFSLISMALSVVYIVFYVKIYKLCSVSEQAFSDQRYWEINK